MLAFFFIVGVLLAIVLIAAFLIADHLGFLPPAAAQYLPQIAGLAVTSAMHRCKGCGIPYHESWEEPAPLPGEDDLRGLGPCCTGAD